MSKTRKGFKKTSGMVEVVLNWNDSYQATTIKAASGLDMKTSGNTKLTLLRMSGSVISDMDIDGHFWTIGRYVEQVFSSRSCRNCCHRCSCELVALLNNE